jgi:hypothetical protein
MAKNGVNVVLVIAIIALGYLVLVGNPFASDATEPTTTEPTATSGGCNIEDVSFQAKMTRLGKAGTSLSTAGNNYFILTDNLGSAAANAATTVPTNYQMDVMFGENSTTYYTVVKSVNTGCSDPKFEAVELALADTSLNSFYAKNSDGTVNSASDMEAMGADDTYETTVTMKAGSDTYFGNPDSSCENIAVVEYDKTFIKQISSDDARPVPGAFTYNNASYDGSSAFAIPKVGDGEEASFNVIIESTTNNPDGSNPPIITVYDCDIDKDEDSLEIIEGVEDEDLNSISLASQQLTIYVN